ncbi:hypothetical protein SAMN05428988_5615 [Chitinophaga sp. YR573]|uniref:sensor histidine kinase n=1 Tax=Chitinophaga sp. YR573 TaxID=1881040 RepID=UPI0008AD7BB4|nr:ATP-binding protein [Chitinophaga sp. YR573]SEW43719.1 hypothetical protein SAMN05428988_5615 [Chitinophaga sp. YR573]
MEQHIDKGIHKGDNEEWMRFALVSSGFGTWELDLASNQVIWDDRCRELYGYPAEGDLSQENIRKNIHPEDRERVIAAVDKALRPESGGLYDIIFRTVSTTDKQLRWVRCIGKAYFNNGVACRFAGTIQDISADIKDTEKRQLLLSRVESYPDVMGAVTDPEPDAAREQQKLLALLENCRDFVSLSDEEGNVSYVNAAGLKLLGLNSQEEARRHNSEYLMPEEIGKLKDVINKQLFSKGAWSGEVLYRHFKTGEAIPVEGTTMLVYDPVTGNSQGRATISRDLREEKAAHQQRIENELELEKIVEMRTSELKKANIDLNIVNQNLEQFAYVASHDLQEPLRKINMFSALLEDKFRDQLNETGMRNLGIIRNAATRMTTLIQDLLAFSRVSRQDHLFEEIDLSATVQQVLGDFDMLIQQKDAIVECDGLFHVQGIPLHMTQLFHNLLSNALKFSQAGIFPLIKITSRMMEAGEIAGHPQLENGTRYGEIRISDNGIGFAPTYAKKIFVIFQRLHGRGEYEGSGIGLALCQKIVTAHHGVIYADSEEGKGATFVVILPVYT